LRKNNEIWRAPISFSLCVGIDKAKIILFVGSQKSLLSDWCLKELRLGRQKGKLITPIWLEKAEIDSAFKSLLWNKKFIDLSDLSTRQESINLLIKTLKNQVHNFKDQAFNSYTEREADWSSPYFVIFSQISDFDSAIVLKSKFSDNGMLCWYADLRVNQLEEIIKKLHGAFGALIILSPEFLCSDFFLGILDELKKDQKIIFPVVLQRKDKDTIDMSIVGAPGRLITPLFQVDLHFEDSIKLLMHFVNLKEKEISTIEKIKNLTQKSEEALEELHKR